MRLKNVRERGQVLPLATLLIILLLSMVGFSTEVGTAYYLRQSAHAAAESAAMATVLAAMSSVSGSSLTCSTSGTSGTQCSTSATTCSSSPNSPPKTNLDNGCLFAMQNGFTEGGNTTIKITANNTTPPPGNPNVSVIYWAQAAVGTRQPQLFSSLFSSSGLFTGALATAAIVSNGTASGCIYVLSTTASRAMDIEGSEVQTTCGIYINSSNSTAVYIGGNPPGGAGSPAISASSVSIVGNYQNGGQGTIVPSPLTGQTAATDPLASLPEPTAGSCTQTNYNFSQGTTTLSPGTYCGGIHISGGTVTFSAGQYILLGGGLTIDSASTTVTGSGVTFYNTSNSTYSYGTMTISGQPKVTFTAPTSGTYEGIFFFTDRSETSTSQNQINGATNSSIQGTIYMPTVPLLYTGESSTGSYTGLVVNTLEINGSVNFKQDTTGQYTGLSGGGAAAYLIQ
ncbi:MAG TPA: pilus assembly protein TadG-related protein [Bryobacteraceae bacterium]|nr:pilus assembly protein TadG-related protein [Bryobacteraceae bacterium]